MPNHIQNRLTFIGTTEQIQGVRDTIRQKDGESTIDFNNIVQMPESLHTQMHSGIEEAISISLMLPLHNNPLLAGLQELNRNRAKSPLTFSDEDFEKYIIGLQNVKKYGYMNWYEWSIANWGTKWNAYGTPDKRDSDNCIYFETAWSSPIELIRKLSAMLSGGKIELLYADEDSGSNTGKISFKNGEVIESSKPDSQSKEGFDIYFELHPDLKGEYKLVDGKYEYIEEEEDSIS